MLDKTGQQGKGFDLRTCLRRVSLAMVLAMSLRIFQFFPVLSQLQQAWYGLCILGLFVAYPCWKLKEGLRFSHYEIYLPVMMLVEVSLNAGQANRVFGQPLLYGILSQRWILSVGIWLLFAQGLRHGKIRLADVEGAILYLAWGTYFLYTAMRMFLNPGNFSSITGFVAGEGSEASFMINGTFVLFGVFYFALQGLRTGRWKYYLVAAILFPQTLSGGGRGATVFLALTLIFFAYRFRGWRRGTMTALKSAGIGFVLTGMLYLISPAQVTKTVAHFADVFVVLGGSISEDPSANIRVFDVLSATPYIVRHPWLGSGTFSAHWSKSQVEVLNHDFDPSDIGLIGSVYSFGILGTMLFLYQYRFAWLNIRKLPAQCQSPLLDATKAMLLYTMFSSVETSMFVWSADFIAFMVVLFGAIAANWGILGNLRENEAARGYISPIGTVLVAE
jgi:hypothetical protein